ncbi:MAG: TonB-dependent receptor [Crocinitomicaceae bacterium]
MKKLLFTFIVLFSVFTTFAQLSQNVRGKVVDLETNHPLYGVKVKITTPDSLRKFVTLTNADGNFSILNVPIGKHDLSVVMLTYDTKVVTIEVNSGKETIVNIGMQQSFTDIEEVVVSARKKGEIINELATVSAQQFSVEETNRYPGSRSDPARMASNFAGVQGADDSRNDIIIRGNSPLGVVWKVEGIDIPNPSHFATAGSSGGPVSALNNKILGNSDFFMSAFPAEYGNSVSGIFDLKLRNGNNENHEFTGQFGLLGTEIAAEGPLSKSHKSSYLVMGRYSTLSMFQSLGIQIGTSAVPVYGDGALKLNWALKKGGTLALFAIGGKSNIDITVSNQTEVTDELYGEGDRDQYFGTSMLTSGLVYKKSLNEKTYLTSTLGYSHDESNSHHNFLIRSVYDENGVQKIKVDSLFPLMGYYFKTSKISYYLAVTHKFTRRSLIKAGINFDGYYLNQKDSVLNQDSLNMGNYSTFNNRWDYKGTSMLIQPFVQWKYRINENMDFTAGLHAQYFSLSNSISPLEPRLGWKYRMKKAQSISLGAGLHSQMQPLYSYNYHLLSESPANPHNQKMDFTKSLHSALGYEKSFSKSFNVRSEVYYQYLYNIPVEIHPSAFSMVNMGSGFQRFFPDTLTNSGTGYNYGLEVTVQKFFDKSFFFLFSGTLYDSKYLGSDKVLRNTSYNGNYVTNLLAGKEFKLNQKNSISLGLKVTYAGGKRYGYVDLASTKTANELIYMDSAFNTRQFKDYFRVDMKINWKKNAQRVTHEIGLDLVNVLGTKNLLSLTYAPNVSDPSAEPIAQRYQLGFLPIFYYKIDFRGRPKVTVTN